MTKKKDPKDYVKVGRPTDMTPETIMKLEQAFAMGCSDLEACLLADISKTTLYNYQQKHPEFVDRKEMLKEKLVLKARTVIANSLNNQDENTAKWYLERKKGDEFSVKTENKTKLQLTQALVQFIGNDDASSSEDSTEVQTLTN